MKNNRFLFLLAVVAALVFLPSFTVAQEHLFLENTTTEHEPVRLPDDQDIENAIHRARNTMQQLDVLEKGNAVAIPRMPDIDALPKPDVPAGDISIIAEKFRDMGQANADRMRSHDQIGRAHV